MPSTPDSRAGWASYARALTIRDHAFIDGAFQPAADADTFPSINPADGTVIADVAARCPDDVDLAVAAARRSFEAGSWSRATPARPAHVRGDDRARLLAHHPEADRDHPAGRPELHAHPRRLRRPHAGVSQADPLRTARPGGRHRGASPCESTGSRRPTVSNPGQLTAHGLPTTLRPQPQIRVRGTYIAGSSVFSA